MVELSFTAGCKKPLVIGLGFFDCVHTGHRKLIQTVTEYAALNKCSSCIATFSNNPYRIFNSDAKVIYVYAERILMLQNLGVDYVLPFQFDTEFKATEKKIFLDKLTRHFKVKAVVCGYDYLFGNKGEGDVEYLKAYGQKKGVQVIVIDPVEVDGERVSSTRVKECIERGNIEQANHFLSQPFFIQGTVVAGNGIGRQIGFPTANITFKKSKLVPPDGVYQTQVSLDGILYRAVTHIGARPTFSDIKRTVETHIINFSGELYGEEIKIEFLKRLRDVQKFNSNEKLTEQINKDLRA